jgi:hypothetical protein
MADMASQRFPLGCLARYATSRNRFGVGFNFKIQSFKSDTRGFRSLKYYRYRSRFPCGKLELDPILPSLVAPRLTH